MPSTGEMLRQQQPVRQFDQPACFLEARYRRDESKGNAETVWI
jgi:hypothetical protein